jgi:hypothetical protein
MNDKQAGEVISNSVINIIPGSWIYISPIGMYMIINVRHTREEKGVSKPGKETVVNRVNFEISQISRIHKSTTST